MTLLSIPFFQLKKISDKSFLVLDLFLISNERTFFVLFRIFLCLFLDCLNNLLELQKTQQMVSVKFDDLYFITIHMKTESFYLLLQRI